MILTAKTTKGFHKEHKSMENGKLTIENDLNSKKKGQSAKLYILQAQVANPRQQGQQRVSSEKVIYARLIYQE
jgi:hypothetical protein